MVGTLPGTPPARMSLETLAPGWSSAADDVEDAGDADDVFGTSGIERGISDIFGPLGALDILGQLSEPEAAGASASASAAGSYGARTDPVPPLDAW
jgi:hypothetical protein